MMPTLFSEDVGDGLGTVNCTEIYTQHVAETIEQIITPASSYIDF